MLSYFSRPPGSTPPSRDQLYLISVLILLTRSQMKASPLSALSALRTSAAGPPPSLFSLAPHCESHLPNQRFRVLSNPCCLSLLYAVRPLSPFTDPSAIFQLLYNLSGKIDLRSTALSELVVANQRQVRVTSI